MFDKQRGALAKLKQAKEEWATTVADAQRRYNVSISDQAVINEMRLCVTAAAQGDTYLHTPQFSKEGFQGSSTTVAS